ncbi:Nn.00g062510.m01.CDS01 [Neocucurbitaria sp. VM-36]
MATANVEQLQKVAGMNIAEHEFNDKHAVSDEKTSESAHSNEKDDATHQKHSDLDLESIDSNQPAGLKKMEAITIVWTKNWLIAAYASIMLISFVNSLQQQANYSWTPYVTSSFMLHGLTGITGIVANVVGGVSRLPLAKFIDLVGRPQGFLICLVCVVLSLLLMGVCQNVQTYAAAQVFYWSGMNGMDYVFTIFIADTSLMQNRLIWFAWQGTPYIVNTFAGPELGQRFLDDSTWRWGYGAFTIITPVIGISFWAIFWLMGRRAQQVGVVMKTKSGRTLLQNIYHWSVEFDVIGLLLVCGGFSIFLLPFSLAAYQSKGWASPLVICMIVFGFLLIVLFAVWEKFFAPKTFFPFHLMKDRSVVAACLLGCNSWIAFYSYKMYYSSYLQVVFGLSVSKAGYITNIFNIVSCTWAVLISYAFKYTDRYKWGAIVAMPIQVLMTGLLIHFRAPGTKIGLLVMVEVFAAMCGAMLVQIEQMSIMAAVPHEHMATGLALLAMITSVGGSIGQTISAAIWTQMLPAKITEYLPAASKDQAPSLYASLPAVLLLPWESPERQAVVRAYGDAQKIMIIVGTCALLPCFLWVAMIKNYRMSEHKQRKGLQA